MAEKSTKKERCIVEKTLEPCLVCASPTSKLHLQVNSCYACAAFYRRSLEAHINYKCQTNTEKCDLTVKKIGKPLCRLCRYNKCVEIGMVINKKEEKPHPNKDPDPILENLELPSISEEPLYTNMEKNFAELRAIFMKNAIEASDTTDKSDYTKEFSDLISKFIEALKPKPEIALYEKKHVIKRVQFLHIHFFATAKMISKYAAFSSLPIDDKISLFCHFWQLFRSFERMYQAIRCFSADESDYRLPCSFDEYFDIGNMKTIYHTSIPNSNYYNLILPVFQKGMQLISTFKKLNPTFEEFVYISQIGLWSCHEMLNITPKTQALAEEITTKISEDLHNYYINELRVASYSARQAQLFKNINTMETVLRSRKQMVAARNIFNFGSNFFPYCNFETNYYDYIAKNML